MPTTKLRTRAFAKALRFSAEGLDPNQRTFASNSIRFSRKINAIGAGKDTKGLKAEKKEGRTAFIRNAQKLRRLARRHGITSE